MNWEQQEGGQQVPASGQPRADWYPDPYDPSRVRYWDGTAWTEHSQPAHPPTPAGPAAPTGSLRGPALTVKIFFWILLGLSVIAVASDFAERGLLARLAEDAGSVEVSEANSSDARQAIIGIFQALVFLGTAIAFLVWFHRAYRDRALDRGMLRYSTGWAIGGWFVPFLNLVRPKQMMDDIWRASGPTRAAYGPEGRPPVPFLLHAWWVVFLLSNFAGQVAFRMSLGATDTIQQIQSASAVQLFSDLLDIPSTILALIVVMRVTERILERGRLMDGSPA